MQATNEFLSIARYSHLHKLTVINVVGKMSSTIRKETTFCLTVLLQLVNLCSTGKLIAVGMKVITESFTPENYTNL